MFSFMSLYFISLSWTWTKMSLILTLTNYKLNPFPHCNPNLASTPAISHYGAKLSLDPSYFSLMFIISVHTKTLNNSNGTQASSGALLITVLTLTHKQTMGFRLFGNCIIFLRLGLCVRHWFIIHDEGGGCCNTSIETISADY